MEEKNSQITMNSTASSYKRSCHRHSLQIVIYTKISSQIRIDVGRLHLHVTNYSKGEEQIHLTLSQLVELLGVAYFLRILLLCDVVREC